MSGRSVSETIAERRLRHVYDYLDSGNNKKAVQEAEKVLKKHPDALLAKTLKSLALIRLARKDEAWDLIEEVEKENPMEEHTLAALTHCFKELSRHDRIALLYEGVCSRGPAYDEFLTHLFMAYVRLREYKKQQQTAMQIYKIKPNNPYYFWAVMSLVMQGMENPALAKTMFYPLAEKMVRKFQAEDKIQAEAEVRILLIILEKQEKYAEALELIQSGLAEKYVRNMWDKHYRIIGYLEELSQWEETLELCITHLHDNVDDWRLYTSLFDAMIALIELSPNKKDQYVSTTTDLVLSLIKGEEEKREGGRCRGPYLARLQLILSLLEKDMVVRAELDQPQRRMRIRFIAGEPMTLLMEFFRLFGHKPPCTCDMRPYLCLLGEQQQTEFLKDVYSSICPPNGSEPSLLKSFDIQRLVTYIQLSRCLGTHKSLNSSAKISLINTFMAHREKCRATEGVVKSSEIPCSDFLVMMAVQLIWDLHTEQGDTEYLVQIAVILESCLKESPANFHMKYTLAKIYALLGGSSLVQEYVGLLDIKYIQKDSLGYLMYDQFSQFGQFSGTVSWLNEVGAFFGSCDKEVLEALAQSYKLGSFAKIPEIAEYQERCKWSFHRVASQVSLPFFQILSNLDSSSRISEILAESIFTDPSADLIEWGKLRDNRDFTCLPSWEPGSGQHRQEEIAQSFKEAVDVLKLRHYVLRIISWMRESVKQGTETRGETSGKVSLASLLTQLHAHFYHCAPGSSSLSPQYSLQGPTVSRFSLYLEGGYFPVLTTLLSACHALLFDSAPGLPTPTADNGTAKSHSPTDQSPERLNFVTSPEDMQGLMRRMFSSHQLNLTPSERSDRKETPPAFPFLQLTHISYLVQTIGLSLLICQLAWFRLQPSSAQSESSSKKSSKKKSAKGDQSNGVTITETPGLIRFRSLVGILCNAPSSIERLLDDMTMLNSMDIQSLNLADAAKSELEQNLPCFEKERSRLHKRLQTSYKKSIDEMQAVVVQQQQLAKKLAKLIAK